ncbi:OB-fold domain-containing protein [Frankia sp. CNm7]|uniref:OB-fold domain-containing protein n=1 Tax=Frankia nepalensis TaxID=1836974 RepID=A0A937RL29_9ACTN|nr:zinc ribbon domain-containing protein [Frankia nepalensis]MBL7499155.1 OB-fold domain-containing protein [Frankia nepalensis]MBL7511027.1 OB-fold domain-containing protein [Frankia nepalensis]MBL7520505.1 OB-fold domain-containing protein [Frankia nepalensis]MBL7632107.1 OB-fold domain-containing protein [Frankia nepalensis]
MPYPVPVPDELSRPFWDAVNERRLVLQYCAECERLQYPPQHSCAKCGSSDRLGWREVEGTGHIRTYIVSHDTRIALKQPDQPFNVAVVTLDTDPGITFLSNLPGTPVDEVPVGAAVELTFVEAEPGTLIHEWRVTR